MTAEYLNPTGTNENAIKTQPVRNDNIVVLGIYADRVALEFGVDQLKDAGFRNADISALLPSIESTKEFSHEKATKAPEGATTGAATGAVVGGTLGWLAGIGAIAIPGVGPFIAAGPIVGMLAGLGVGGTIGGLTGALIGMGIPEYEAKRYEGRIKKGGMLLSVHCDTPEWRDRAKGILRQTGATDITATDEASADSGRKKDKPRPMASNY